MEGGLWDVIVIGGGISGVTAAYELTKAGKRVALLEASDRFGGRTSCIKTPNGHPVDLGGQFVYEEGQPNITKLLNELAIQTYPQHWKGVKCLELKDGTKSKYNSSIPSLPVHALLDLQLNGLNKIESLAKLVPVENPCLSEKAIELDGMTVADLANKYMWTSAARQMIAVAVQTIFGMELEDISALFFLFYVSASNGIDSLVEIENGAQQDRIRGGTGEIFTKIVPKLETTILGMPVFAINQNETDREVEVIAGGKDKTSVFRARHVILAIPPTQAAQIEFSPPLPLVRQQMMRRGVMGMLIKIILGYSLPFWRKAGMSGELVCYGGDPLTQPVGLAYDACGYDIGADWREGEYGCGDGAQQLFALTVFIGGAFAVFWSERSEQERREAVVKHLSKHFGEEATTPLYYLEKDWSKEKYTRGCPVVILPPGVLSLSCKVTPRAPKYALREPVGLCHFAGTETATQWVGFMDGAVQSGVRAAGEVISRQAQEGGLIHE